MTPSARRQVATLLVDEHRLSVVRACGVVRLARAAYYRRPLDRLERDHPVIAALQQLLATEGARWGCDKLTDRLRALGHPWNPKRIRRVYRTLGLTHRRRTTRRVPTRTRFWIENGEITYAVSEVTIAGHLFEIFKSMAPANDLEFRYGVNAPTVRIDGLTLGGR